MYFLTPCDLVKLIEQDLRIRKKPTDAPLSRWSTRREGHSESVGSSHCARHPWPRMQHKGQRPAEYAASGALGPLGASEPPGMKRSTTRWVHTAVQDAHHLLAPIRAALQLVSTQCKGNNEARSQNVQACRAASHSHHTGRPLHGGHPHTTAAYSAATPARCHPQLLVRTRLPGQRASCLPQDLRRLVLRPQPQAHKGTGHQKGTRLSRDANQVYQCPVQGHQGAASLAYRWGRWKV